jgi:IS5 family transposase
MPTVDFFRARLDTMIDMNHSLVILSQRFPWSEIELILKPFFSSEVKEKKVISVEDLFGTTDQIVGGVITKSGRPRLSIRLMVALLILKHTYNESDESVVERWSQDVYFQYFSGCDYFEAKKPCDPTQIGRFRHAIGESGLEKILACTVNVAVAIKAVKAVELETVIVDSTVQEKAIAHPTDGRLLEIARMKLVLCAKRANIKLKQSFQKEGKCLRFRGGGYARAKQFKRMRKVINRQRTIVGILIREIQRKMAAVSDETKAILTPWLERAQRLVSQRRADKNKLYALHAPEVECIGKGKARNPYEFGVKVGFAISHKKGLIVGAKSFPGNPYDGHTLAAQIEQTNMILMNQGVTVKTAYVDLGYRKTEEEVAPTTVIHRGKVKSLTKQQRQNLKRRQAIEPIIGHIKQDHGMQRCWLKGKIGDAIHAISCAIGFNIRWLLRAIIRIGVKPFFALIFLCQLFSYQHIFHSIKNAEYA